jgi:hypothetical protein
MYILHKITSHDGKGWQGKNKNKQTNVAQIIALKLCQTNSSIYY